MFQSGFNQNNVTPMTGFNDSNFNPAIRQQPFRNGNARSMLAYNFGWAEKPSQNGEFKYGLFECCSGPNNGCLGLFYIILCLIPFPGWLMVATLNSEVASVVGK